MKNLGDMESMPTVDSANAEAVRACYPKMSAAGYLRSFEKILSERDNDAIERTLLFRVLERWDPRPEWR